MLKLRQVARGRAIRAFRRVRAAAKPTLHTGAHRRWLAAAGAGSISLLASAWCEAKPLSFMVELDRSSRAADCVEQRVLTERISRLSPRATAIKEPRKDAVHVVVRMDRFNDEYSASLSFFGPKPGERTLSDRGPNCRSLGDAVAVAIAMLLDSEMDRDEVVRPEPPLGPSKVRITSAQILPNPHSSLPTLLQLSLQGGASWGFVPQASASFEAAVGVIARERWLLEWSAMDWLPQRVKYEMGEVSVDLVALAARGCRVWGKQWQLASCAALALGRLHGKGRGFDESTSTSLVWTAGGGSVMLDREVSGPMRVALHAMAWIPLTEQSLAIHDLGTAWKPAPIWFGVTARVAIRFH